MESSRSGHLIGGFDIWARFGRAEFEARRRVTRSQHPHHEPLPAPHATKAVDVVATLARLQRDLGRDALSLQELVAPEELVALALRALNDTRDADAMFCLALASDQSRHLVEAVAAIGEG